MTFEDIYRIELSYLSLFSKHKKRASGLIFYDENQQDKYAHNLFMLTHENVEISELKQYEKLQAPYGFVKFRTAFPSDIHFQFLMDYQKNTLAYYASLINHLEIKKKRDAEIHLIDPSRDDHFFEFMYQEDLPFGESYAKGNVKRQKEVLTVHKDNYFYLGLKLNNVYIGHLNALVIGKQAKIDEFYIIEAHQKQGFGSALMLYMIEYLKKKGVEEVYLVTDLSDTAFSLYEKYGMNQISTFKEYQKSFTASK